MVPEIGKWRLGENGVITCFFDGALSWKHKGQSLLPTNTELFNDKKILVLVNLTSESSGEYTCYSENLHNDDELMASSNILVFGKSKKIVPPKTMRRIGKEYNILRKM